MGERGTHRDHGRVILQSSIQAAICHLKSAFQAALDPVLAVLLAPSCAACGQLLEHPSEGPVCESCWRSILPLTPPVCDRCGDPLPAWRAISIPLARCPRCRRGARHVDRARAVGGYDGALRAIVHALKYEGRRSLARPLAELMRIRGADMLTGADWVVPVPLAPVAAAPARVQSGRGPRAPSGRPGPGCALSHKGDGDADGAAGGKAAPERAGSLCGCSRRSRLRPCGADGQRSHRRRISVSSRWGWGPSASAKKLSGRIHSGADRRRQHHRRDARCVCSGLEGSRGRAGGSRAHGSASRDATAALYRQFVLTHRVPVIDETVIERENREFEAREDPQLVQNVRHVAFDTTGRGRRSRLRPELCSRPRSREGKEAVCPARVAGFLPARTVTASSSMGFDEAATTKERLCFFDERLRSGCCSWR